MYKAIKDDKIIAISETEKFPCLIFDRTEKDLEHQISDYKHYDGEFLLCDPQKDNEEQKQARANAYLQEVDPITAHIQRLRDEEGSEEKIKELIEQRKQKVEEIKERYPYKGE